MLHRDLPSPDIRQRIQIIIHPLEATDLRGARLLRHDRAAVGQLGAALGAEARAAQLREHGLQDGQAAVNDAQRGLERRPVGHFAEAVGEVGEVLKGEKGVREAFDGVSGEGGRVTQVASATMRTTLMAQILCGISISLLETG